MLPIGDWHISIQFTVIVSSLRRSSQICGQLRLEVSERSGFVTRYRSMELGTVVLLQAIQNENMKHATFFDSQSHCLKSVYVQLRME
jgi:hypothetical protein